MATLKSTTIHGTATVKVADTDESLNDFLVVDSAGEIHKRTGTAGSSGSSGTSGSSGSSGS